MTALGDLVADLVKEDAEITVQDGQVHVSADEISNRLNNRLEGNKHALVLAVLAWPSCQCETCRTVH